MNNNERNKQILRYAALTAKEGGVTAEEKEELVAIETELHLTKEALLREATKLGLAQLK